MTARTHALSLQASFPELPAVLLYLRVVLSVVAGCFAAAFGATGWAGFFYWIACIAATYVLKSWLVGAVDEFVDASHEGIMPSWGAFVLSWSICYGGI